ncbi:PrgI family protein [Nocardiopsis composta]
MPDAEEVSRWRARIPADIDRPEPVVAGLTARQLLICVPPALGMWAAYLAVGGAVPTGVLAAVALPVAAVVAVVALGRRDGLGLDAYALAAAAWWRTPKKHTPTARAGRLPTWAPRHRPERLAPLRLPASAISDEGVIDLGDREAAILACSTLNFHLASGREQDAAIGAYALVLDSLTHPVQICLQGRPLDLSPTPPCSTTTPKACPTPPWPRPPTTMPPGWKKSSTAWS